MFLLGERQKSFITQKPHIFTTFFKFLGRQRFVNNVEGELIKVCTDYNDFTSCLLENVKYKKDFAEI